MTSYSESLNILEQIAKILKHTQINIKKCPKARLTKNYINTRVKCIDEYWQKYLQAYDDIIRCKPKTEDCHYLSNDEFYEHEELYIDLKSHLLDLSGSEEVPHNDPEVQVVLPKIQIPMFSGQYEEWMSFHDLFNALVHTNRTLSNVQKLYYLKTSVTGEAATILKHIQVTESNYEKAWDTLKIRFGNKRITVNSIMKRLFSQKKITNSNSSYIKNLLDTSFECLHHLNNMAVNTENWDPILIFVLVQKLDSETHKDWEEHVSNNCNNIENLPSLEMLRKFLENRFRTLELTESVKIKPAYQENVFHMATTNEKVCKKCLANHSLSHCKVFSKCTPTERNDFIKSNNLCFNCLSSGHSVRYCRIPTSCRLCRRRHHSLLHETTNNGTSSTKRKAAQQQLEVTLCTSEEEDEREEGEEEDITMVASHVITNQGTSLLATALVQVESEDKEIITIRALVDQGSQASFISERAAQLLKAKRYPVKGTVVGVGSTTQDIKQLIQINIKSRNEPDSLQINTFVMSQQLTSKLPSQTLRTSNWPHLNGLVLADPEYHKPGSIDLILGVDVYTGILQNQFIKGPPGSPCAHKTTLGWIIFGLINKGSQPDCHSYTSLCNSRRFFENTMGNRIRLKKKTYKGRRTT